MLLFIRTFHTFYYSNVAKCLHYLLFYFSNVAKCQLSFYLIILQAILSNYSLFYFSNVAKHSAGTGISAPNTESAQTTTQRREDMRLTKMMLTIFLCFVVRLFNWCFFKWICWVLYWYIKCYLICWPSFSVLWWAFSTDIFSNGTHFFTNLMLSVALCCIMLIISLCFGVRLFNWC